MRVVMFVRNAFTHDARVTREARALVDAGHEVYVLAVRADRTLPRTERMHGFTVERLAVRGRALGLVRRLAQRRAERRARPAGAGSASSAGAAQRRLGARGLAVKGARTLATLRFNLRAARRARALKPDVYHCHDFNTLYAGLLAAARSPAPIVYDSHELYAHLNVDQPLRLRRVAVELLERRWIRKAAAVITVSEAFAEHLAKRYRIRRPTVVMNVPAPPDRAVEHPVPAALERDGVRLLYVGGIQRHRGIEQSIHALRALDPGVHLVLMGPAFPDEERRLRALVAELGLGERVAFVPPVPHEAVTHVSSRATLGLIPFQPVCLSHELTIPNKLFESIHAGLPVVASDFAELRRIVEGHDIGAVCDPTDPAAIADAVRRIVDDPQRYAEMRENVRAAARLFTWDRERRKLLDVYARVGP